LKSINAIVVTKRSSHSTFMFWATSQMWCFANHCRCIRTRLFEFEIAWLLLMMTMLWTRWLTHDDVRILLIFVEERKASKTKRKDCRLAKQ
jgi:hypothetical protein